MRGAIILDCNDWSFSNGGLINFEGMGRLGHCGRWGYEKERVRDFSEGDFLIKSYINSRVSTVSNV